MGIAFDVFGKISLMFYLQVRFFNLTFQSGTISFVGDENYIYASNRIILDVGV